MHGYYIAVALVGFCILFAPIASAFYGYETARIAVGAFRNGNLKSAAAATAAFLLLLSAWALVAYALTA